MTTIGWMVLALAAVTATRLLWRALRDADLARAGLRIDGGHAGYRRTAAKRKVVAR